MHPVDLRGGVYMPLPLETSLGDDMLNLSFPDIIAVSPGPHNKLVTATIQEQINMHVLEEFLEVARIDGSLVGTPTVVAGPIHAFVDVLYQTLEDCSKNVVCEQLITGVPVTLHDVSAHNNVKLSQLPST